MIHHRTGGIYRLLGASIVLVLPLAFYLVYWFSTNVLHVVYAEFNLMAYLGGAAAAALICHDFYREPAGLAPRVGWVWRVSNVQVAVLATVMFGLAFAIKDQGISRKLIGIYLVFAWALLLIINAAAPAWLARFLYSGRNLRSCVVIGGAEATQRVRDWLVSLNDIGYEVVGQLTWDGTSAGDTPWPILGHVADLDACIRRRGIHQVILLETRQSPEIIRRVAGICENQGCRLLIYNPWAGVLPQPLIAVTEGGHTYFVLSEEPLENPINRFFKRALDLLVAIPVVLFLLPILIPIVWLGQRRDSPGPIFFRQRRRGFNRREFFLYKFRTMRLAAGQPINEARQATKDDPRVFAFGEWLRRTSLDEFPQFFNVVRGDMSVVGPRPHLPEHDQLFHQYVHDYPQRHFAKPGLTGLAQSQGYRGEITDVEVLRRRVHLDLEYINHWTLLLDVQIIFRTLGQVLRPPKTAY